MIGTFANPWLLKTEDGGRIELFGRDRLVVLTALDDEASQAVMLLTPSEARRMADTLLAIAAVQGEETRGR